MSNSPQSADPDQAMVESDHESSSSDSDPESSDDEYETSDGESYPDTVNCTKTKFLVKALRNASIKSAFDKTSQEFVPEGVVNELIDKKTVKACLLAKGRHAHADIVDFVMTKARKAFAVTTFAKGNSHRAMRWFMKKGLSDQHLPILEQTEEWKKSWRTDFYDRQWRFFAPVFSTTDLSQNFAEKHILPLIPLASKSQVVKKGSFGDVVQHEIHISHLEPKIPNGNMVAVKEMRATDDTQEVAEHWEQEVKALRMMNELNQEHIVRFITAFRRRKEDGTEEHYVVFEWANGGNLRDVWRKTPSPDLTGPLLKDVIKQIHGLAMALEAAHNLNRTEASYRHGDLKPENILVFKKNIDEVLGVLKIGDWGEAKYHGKDQPTMLQFSRTTARSGTLRYQAPEAVLGMKATYLGQPTKRRSRLYDVWALGCVTLEFIVWLLYGLNGLNKFNTDVNGDTFYQLSKENGRDVARVHAVAIRWMDHMAQEAPCKTGGTAIGDLLKIVREKLLVVKLPPQGGNTTPGIGRARPRADSVYQFSLGHMDDSTVIPAMDNLEISGTPPAMNLPTFSFTPAGPPEGQPELDPLPLEADDDSEGPERCLASAARESIDNILREDDKIAYWGTQQQQLQVPVDLANASSASSSKDNSGTPDEEEVFDYAPPELDENRWKLRLDNDFASKLFSGLKSSRSLHLPHCNTSEKLCDHCKDFRSEVLWGPGFSKTYNTSKLSESAEAGNCDVCALLWRLCQTTGGNVPSSLQFNREGAFIKMGSNHNAMLSIVRSPESKAPISTDHQVGFVELPDAGGPTHLGVIQRWISECDKKHTCKPLGRIKDASNTVKVQLPTRLLDVGSMGASKVYLRQTKDLDEDTGEWIALSHKWGMNNYSTTPENLQQHLDGLEFEKLPPTFKDAVTVTRALGHRYLWIDSLCVIQGPYGDFKSEAEKMEEVYSGAYCVIAASCASDHFSGFLKPRKARDYVGLCPNGKNQDRFYICETIDNFKAHVLDGELSARGWVLQEHALARRTIFFTKHQTYFECSEGVRCETSTKMSNLFAAFLGDPEFPNFLYKASQGEKILRIQGLYKQYSRLGLSKPHDRPIAIGGLQQRLIKTIGVQGGFGILDEGRTRGLLRRTLLWRRGADTGTMSRIDFPLDPNDPDAARVPSWSWMAYTGGIDYLDVGFGAYDWEDINTKSPWPQTTNTGAAGNKTNKMALVVSAATYDLGAATKKEVDLAFDNTRKLLPHRSLCVVMGKAKGMSTEKERKHCVLIITPVVSQHGEEVYERIGSGFLPGKCISPKSVTVHIY